MLITAFAVGVCAGVALCGLVASIAPRSEREQAEDKRTDDIWEDFR